MHDFGYDDLLGLIKTIASRGQIEFTGSGKFHPLLPLIPEPEIRRQIKLNNETNKHFFGKLYHPRGFFPPEMAVSGEVFNTVKKMGFEWIIMSGIANTLPKFPTNHISIHPSGLKVLFRDDYISIDCAFDKIKISPAVEIKKLVIDYLRSNSGRESNPLLRIHGALCYHYTTRRKGILRLKYLSYTKK